MSKSASLHETVMIDCSRSILKYRSPLPDMIL
jgi:hypothetical protein